MDNPRWVKEGEDTFDGVEEFFGFLYTFYTSLTPYSRYKLIVRLRGYEKVEENIFSIMGGILDRYKLRRYGLVLVFIRNQPTTPSLFILPQIRPISHIGLPGFIPCPPNESF